MSDEFVHWTKRAGRRWREGGSRLVANVTLLATGGGISWLIEMLHPNGADFWHWFPVLTGTLILAAISILGLRDDQLSRQEVSTLKNKLSSAKNKKDDLQSELSSVKEGVAAVLSTYLRTLAVEIGFHEKSPCQDRITLYSLDREANELVTYLRWSPNRSLKKRHRITHEANSGCLGKALDEGEACEHFPDYKNNANAYLQKSQNMGMSREVVEKLNMKARFYYAWRVLALGGGDPVAIVMVESLEKDRWNETHLHRYFEERKDEIRTFVDLSRDYLPEPTLAADHEF